ncbi:MAG TPA: hypothetical protein EYF98_07130 [Planctomycetes bacterium]|jgi:cytochrome c-type protein NapB|nr:hypothetical protein [Planctomycetota bacterium]
MQHNEQDQPLESYGIPDADSPASRGQLKVALSCLIGASVIGYLVGVQPPHTVEVASSIDDPVDHQATGVVPTLSYGEIDSGNLSPNAGYSSDLSQLLPNLVEPNPKLNTVAAKLQSLQAREQRRAYFGAPPTVPHPVDPISVASCLACHEQGLKIGDRVASAIPHEPYASCTQCHVEQQDLLPTEEWWLRNEFAGLTEPREGTRAFPGAPPTIPHDTLMRSNCIGCHGLHGRDGMRVTHPERASCLQCHALSAGAGGFTR